MSNVIPSFPAASALGNWQQFRKDRLGLFVDVFKRCGDIGAYRVGHLKFILVNSPDLAREVLVEHADDFDKAPNFRRFAAPLLGNGLLTTRNAFHKQQRPLLAPSFQPDHLAKYASVIADYADRACSRWSDGEVIDIQQDMIRLTLWIVGKTLFDAEVLSEADELGAALTDAIHGFNAQLTALVPLTIGWPTAVNLRYRRAIRRVDHTVQRLIAERRATGRDHGDSLSMLLRARYSDGSAMTDEQIRDEVMNMFMPGHETSATALTWTWHLLSQHPHIYERLLDEVDREVGDRTPTLADLARLPYAVQVLKEAMRLYPPVYMFTREAVRDVEIGGYRVRAGSLLVFSPYAMHRRPQEFPDPERFDPDRFSSENEAVMSRHAFMPFGAGRRVCIGNHYAMLSNHLVIATIARRVRFSTWQRHVGMDPMVTLRPKQRIKMTVELRHDARASGSDIDRTERRPTVDVIARCPYHS